MGFEVSCSDRTASPESRIYCYLFRLASSSEGESPALLRVPQAWPATAPDEAGGRSWLEVAFEVTRHYRVLFEFPRRDRQRLGPLTGCVRTGPPRTLFAPD